MIPSSSEMPGSNIDAFSLLGPFHTHTPIFQAPSQSKLHVVSHPAETQSSVMEL